MGSIVLAAAFATRGLCADVMRAVLAEHQLLVGEVVLTELRRALSRRIKVPGADLEDICARHTIVITHSTPS